MSDLALCCPENAEEDRNLVQYVNENKAKIVKKINSLFIFQK